jgi:hypothetical protein
MPPSTLQARIKAFEALGMGASKQVLDTVAIHPEPDLLLDSPDSPTAPSIPPIAPTVYTPSTSPGSLRHRSSLVDLKDWVIDDGPLRTGSPTPILNGYSPKPFEPAPLISFEGSPPKLSKAPPLPPRQSSYNSLCSVSAPPTSPTLISTPPSANMLMPPDADHSYPPTLSTDKPSDGTRRAHGHAQASSVSSFHSVSLSSDAGDPTAVPVSPVHAFAMEREWTVSSIEDGESLDESFENVSAPSSFLPPITLPPRPPKPPAAASKPPPPPLPPKLPQRPPGSAASSLASRGSSPSSLSSPVLALAPSSSSSAPSLTTTRRAPPPLPITSPPPPPPPRSRPPSARTSVQSTATTTSASDRSSLFSTNSQTSFSSRTSVSPSKTLKPSVGSKPSPRARYDALFVANLRAHTPRKPPPPPVPAKRQNAGWRGLSIDHLDQSVHPAPAQEPGPDARLDGRLVCKIWAKSGLEPHRLRDIW